MDLKTAREAVTGPGMVPDEAEAFLELLMSGDLAEDEGAGLLVALAERGETATELAAFVRGLRARAVRVPGPERVLDVCGTGGSGLARFNVSTTAAFVLAAAGIPVAKHGNRGSRRPNGSFDLLDELGVPFSLQPEDLGRLLDETGVCFLFARAVHPAVAAVVPMRKAAGRRTIFNLAGPLANPLGVSHQIIGACDAATAGVLAGALAQLGVSRALVVCGEPGIDECSVTGATRWWLLDGDARREGRFPPPAAHRGVDYAALPGGDAAENAAHFRRLLTGDETGPLHAMLCRNAGLAIDLWEGREPDPAGEGAARAAKLLADGAVQRCFDRHRARALELAKQEDSGD